MNRIATWIIALTMPAMALATEPTMETGVPPTQAASGTPAPANAGVAVPDRPCRGIAGASAGTPGCVGGGRRGNGGPPYGAGYEARRQWQGGGPGRGMGAGMGRNGGRGAGCGR